MNCAPPKPKQVCRQRTNRYANIAPGVFFMAKTTQGLCIACHEPITPGASLCRHCKSFQASWKNHLQYFAGIVGLATVAAGAVVFLVSQWPEARKAVAWRDSLQIISFNNAGALVMSNQGDGQVFVSHLEIGATLSRTSGFSWSIPVNVTVPKDSFSTHRLGLPSLGRGAVWTTVSHVTDAEWDKMLQRLSTKDPCYQAVIAHTSDFRLDQETKALGLHRRTFPVEAAIHYFSSRRGKVIREAFPAVGGLVVQTPCIQGSAAQKADGERRRANGH
jgi:hypothetical protein